MAFIIEALCITLVWIFRSCALNNISVCVVAPNGSPTTNKTTSSVTAFCNISSAPCSTKLRSASIRGRS